ncbi:MAG: hypothetical protein AB1633_10100, partial [Elusimicrobiota bacterium]
MCLRFLFSVIKAVALVFVFLFGMVFSHETDPALAGAIAGFPEARAGLYVHVNSKDGDLAFGFIKGKALLVDCVVLDASYLASIRSQIKSWNLYGKVCVREIGRGGFSYSDNMVNF